jgi:hypothetical protein
MGNQVSGGIDIVPPLAWSEVAPLGIMAMNAQGAPVVTGGSFAAFDVTETLLDRAEGTLHRFTFPNLIAATADLAGPDREAFRQQVAAIVAAFPTHTFGGANRNIRFRGDQLDDQWRIRLNVDGTVRMQTAALTWTDV